MERALRMLARGDDPKAVLEALFNKQSEFARTPKYRIEATADEALAYAVRRRLAALPDDPLPRLVLANP